MATTALVPVEEYLSTSYRPDREYVDGLVLERKLGEFDHGTVQGSLIAILWPLRTKLGIHVIPEQRVQVKPTRFRVPDVCVLGPGYQREQIITHPPFICIEILSKDDRMSEVLSRVQDYIDFGVPYVWILDPQERRAIRCLDGETHEERGGVLRTENPEIAINLAEIFAQS